ncbi:MAG: tRNA uridine-5-carboxymethylaminomethyl(34) synthesis GTPase MnmE [Coraliomargaritaceae bacterium]
MLATETIVALSTPVGESALAIIRLSGPHCAEIERAITGRSKALESRQATLCKYIDINGLELDSGIYIAYSENASFTNEDMLEIMPHGNPLIIQKILEDLIARGCQMAEPGEFTRRAFLNGKIDLSQAEAVADIIHARSNFSLEVARRQLNGSIGQKMSELSDHLLGILAELEAYIDFPEEDLPEASDAGPIHDLKQLIQKVDDLIETNHYSALLQEGIKTVIIGAPNAGKSSLINTLVGSQRAIVSDTPGTTRDFITSYIMLKDYRVEIIDTAGLHTTGDAIEQQGIEKTMELAQNADFYLVIVDHSQPSPSLPDSVQSVLNAKNTLVIENKIDLESKYPQNDFLSECVHCPISLKTHSGIEAFKHSMLTLIDQGMASAKPKGDDAIVLNARHTAALKQAADSLNKALQAIHNQELSELVVVELRSAIDGFSQVVGKIDNEAMLDKLFQKFCIGK